MSRDRTFITILPFMVKDLELSGNELIVYAIIYGFSQDGESSFHGSLSYLSEQTGISKRSVITILKKLVETKKIEREDVFLNGNKFVKYRACKNFTGGEETSLGGEETSLVSGEETSPNNKSSYMKEDNIYSQNSKIDYQKIIDFYNETCVSLPKATKLSDKRKRSIKIAYEEYEESEIMGAFSMAQKSPFLTGENDRGWMADFDWLIKKDNLLKVIEGRYRGSLVPKEFEDIRL